MSAQNTDNDGVISNQLVNLSFNIDEKTLRSFNALLRGAQRQTEQFARRMDMANRASIEFAKAQNRVGRAVRGASSEVKEASKESKAGELATNALRSSTLRLSRVVHYLRIMYGFTAGAVLRYANAMVQADNATLNLAQRTGIAVGQFRELGYAAQMVGATGQAVEQTLEQLMRRGYDLERVQKRLANLSPRQRLFAAEGLGIDPSLIPLLTSDFSKLTAEYRRLQAATGVSADEMAKQFRLTLVQVRRLNTAMGMLGRATALRIFERINVDLVRWRNFIESNFPKIRNMMVNTFTVLTNVIRPFFEIIRATVNVTSWFNGVLERLDTTTKSWLKTIASAAVGWKLLTGVFLASPFMKQLTALAAMFLLIDDYLAYLDGETIHQINWGALFAGDNAWTNIIEGMFTQINRLIEVFSFLWEGPDGGFEGSPLFKALMVAWKLVEHIAGALKWILIQTGVISPTGEVSVHATPLHKANTVNDDEANVSQQSIDQLNELRTRTIHQNHDLNFMNDGSGNIFITDRKTGVSSVGKLSTGEHGTAALMTYPIKQGADGEYGGYYGLLEHLFSQINGLYAPRAMDNDGTLRGDSAFLRGRDNFNNLTQGFMHSMHGMDYTDPRNIHQHLGGNTSNSRVTTNNEVNITINGASPTAVSEFQHVMGQVFPGVNFGQTTTLSNVSSAEVSR